MDSTPETRYLESRQFNAVHEASSTHPL